MNPKRRKRPSGSFVAVCIVYCLTILFFAWGSSTPDLDRVWTLHHLLKIGAMAELNEDDKDLLEHAMARHPKLASALIGDASIGLISAHVDGWVETPCATLLRTPQSRTSALTLEVQTPSDLLPLELLVSGSSGWSEKRLIGNHGALQVPLEQCGDRPEIIEVRLIGKGLLADPSVLATRITFEETR